MFDATPSRIFSTFKSVRQDVIKMARKRATDLRTQLILSNTFCGFTSDDKEVWVLPDCRTTHNQLQVVSAWRRAARAA